MSLSLPYLGVRGVRGISGGKPCLICGHVEDSDPNQSNHVIIGNFTRKTERAQYSNSEYLEPFSLRNAMSLYWHVMSTVSLSLCNCLNHALHDGNEPRQLSLISHKNGWHKKGMS